MRLSPSPKVPLHPVAQKYLDNTRAYLRYAEHTGLDSREAARREAEAKKLAASYSADLYRFPPADIGDTAGVW